VHTIRFEQSRVGSGEANLDYIEAQMDEEVMCNIWHSYKALGWFARDEVRMYLSNASNNLNF